MVIAQVNPHMPRTWGDSFVHLDEIDFLVLHEEPLVEDHPQDKDPEVARRIGLYVSQLIDDGATLQIGFGNLPHAILPYLDSKQDLGLHTQVITDGLIPLFEKNHHEPQEKPAARKGRGIALHGYRTIVQVRGQQSHVLFPFVRVRE